MIATFILLTTWERRRVKKSRRACAVSGKNDLQGVMEEIVNGFAGLKVFRDPGDQGGMLLGERLGVEIIEGVLVRPGCLFLKNVPDGEALDRENGQASFTQR